MTRQTRLLALGAGILEILSSTPAHADNIMCSGYIDNTFVDTSGNLLVLMNAKGTWTKFCSLTAAWKGVNPQTCFAWYGTINTAVANSKWVIVYYFGQPSCAAVPTYEDSPAPGYVLLAR